jgi:hypothetical protein
MMVSAGLGRPQQFLRSPLTANPGPRITVRTITKHGFEQLAGNFSAFVSRKIAKAMIAIITAGYSP